MPEAATRQLGLIPVAGHERCCRFPVELSYSNCVQAGVALRVLCPVRFELDVVVRGVACVLSRLVDISCISDFAIQGHERQGHLRAGLRRRLYAGFGCEAVTTVVNTRVVTMIKNGMTTRSSTRVNQLRHARPACCGRSGSTRLARTCHSDKRGIVGPSSSHREACRG